VLGYPLRGLSLVRAVRAANSAVGFFVLNQVIGRKLRLGGLGCRLAADHLIPLPKQVH
jgi:hypothetical protein